MTCRDWIKTLRRASYRGRSFFVSTDTIDTGNRLAVHEFPYGNTPYIEPLGNKAVRISVTAYLASDTADDEERALRKACETWGAGALVLPMERMQAHCESCKRDFAKDKLGYIAVSMSFVREGAMPSALPFAFGLRLVAAAVAGIAGLIRPAFVSAYRGLGAAGFVANAAVAWVETAAATFDLAVDAIPTRPDKTPALRRAIADLHRNASTLVNVGSAANRFDALSYVERQDEATAAPIVAAIADIVDMLREAALEPVYAVRALRPLLDFEMVSVQPPAISAGTRLLHANIGALDSVVRQAAFAHFVLAVLDQPLADRREAIQARADLAELLQPELARLNDADQTDLYVALDKMRGDAIRQITQRITDLAPVLRVSGEKTMPALWWSQRLYGDGRRWEEIIERNGVKHASFMPLEFDALAR